MANFRIADTTRNAMANAIRDAIDGGAGPGTIKIYSGTQPADADDALGAQVLLATLTFADPCAPGAASGVLTFSAIVEDTQADATNTATWARIQSSAGTNVFDCDVNTAGATINLNTVSIVANGPVRMNSGSITIPAG